MKSKKQNIKSCLSCTYCDKEFKYESERKRHEQSHSPQFECKVCSKKFSFMSAVRRHEKQHERKGYVMCNECNRKFRDESLLKRHIKYAHKGSFACSKCEATFSSELALRSHAKTHRPVAERRYQCSFNGCSKTFNFTHHLKHHELTHTNTKQHYCNVCGKGFIQSHHLKSHKKTHEPENWLSCDIPGCNKSFPTEYAKKRHMATHDRKYNPEENPSIIKPSCDITDLIEPDTVKCSSCKQILLRQHYTEHLSNCLLKKETERGNILDKNDQVLTKLEPVKLDFDDDLSSCKSFVGGCIIGAHDNVTDKCLCAQISAALPAHYIEPTVIDNKEELFIDSGSIKPNSDKANDCQGCDCAEFKKINEANNTKDVLPEIEYRRDGTIRLRDTFDLDIDVVKKEGVAYSCKDVLGNCIVSGNGTIGEGCLCARMAVDDQQVSAQEIEELTPCPKTQ